MKSEILSLNKSLFRMQLSTVSWIGSFLAIALLIVLPVSILTRELSAVGQMNETPGLFAGSDLNTLMAFSYPFQLSIIAVFPVLVSVVLMNFMTKKQATDLMHSLPFTRIHILKHLYVTGLSVLTGATLLTGLALLIVRPFLEQQFYSYTDIGVWMMMTLFMMVLMFSLSMFTGILVGNSLLHGTLTYVLIFVPALLVILAIVNLQYFILGLAQSAYIETIGLNGILFARWIEMTNRPLVWQEYLIHGGIAITLIALSFLFYRWRHSEATEETIVFTGVRHVFLYGLTFFFMLIAGLYFSEVLGGGLVWTFIGYFIGAVVAYTFLQMIIQKALRLKWPWKGFLAYALTIAVLMVPVQITASVYENTIPEPADIAYGKVYAPYTSFTNQEEERRIMETETLAAMTALHQSLIDHARTTEPDSWHRISLEYRLENGRTLQREYTVSDQFLREETLGIRETEEFKRAYDPAFLAGELDLTFATVHGDLRNSDGDNRIAGQEDLDQLLEALQADAENRPSYALSSNQYAGIGSIQFEAVGNEWLSITLTDADVETIRFLDERGFSDILMTAENIEEIHVMTWDGGDFYEVMQELEMNEVEVTALSENMLTVVDDSEQAELLSYGNLYQEGAYIAIVETYYGYRFYGYEPHEAPVFVTDYFE
ncbi:hypothetical protein [Salisediminibacterium selenitireducens]|uniref:ABC-2 type transport system permease protein n=1 Tax=Bacillus selenitireducens (strain ATCC 700615 / DSM 15326 / MLS10) TaxID=439292 RepID=D6Y0W2_BACIE|nr:hypothetical protein [Salisediminibacterium selenitireducens]ADI00680.1 hypothetical protein Bsel_3198 [[Bacillus] selenitireducens MLS10]